MKVSTQKTLTAFLLTIPRVKEIVGLLVFLTVTIVLKPVASASFFFLSTGTLKTRTTRCYESTEHVDRLSDATTLLPCNIPPIELQIPIFPLRKKVRFPTEPLILNLYDERYLSMAENIQLSTHKMFGAIFAANMYHVVPQGKGPVVPIAGKGDVGVLFLLDDLSERAANDVQIPTHGGTTRRRIRLESKAVARFEVSHICHNGYRESEEGQPLVPFIVADVKLLFGRLSRATTAAGEQQQQTGFCAHGNLENDLHTLASRTTEAISLFGASGYNRSDLELHLLSELRSFQLASESMLETASQDRLQFLYGKGYL